MTRSGSDREESSNFDFAFDNEDFSDHVLCLRVSPDGDPKFNDQRKAFQEAAGSTIALLEPLADPARMARVRVHVNSAILAVRSRFFRQLFSKVEQVEEGVGDQRAAVLHVTPEEELPVMEMLRFAYTHALSPEMAGGWGLVRLALVADRYGLHDAVRHAATLLQRMPMSVSSAVLVLALASVSSPESPISDAVTAARTHLQGVFPDLDRASRTHEFLSMPLVGVEAVLGWEGLAMSCEAVCLNAVIKWGRHNFPSDNGRRAAAITKLARFVKFPWMTPEQLRVASGLPEMHTEGGRELITEALFFKAEPYHRQQQIVTSTSAHSRYKQLGRPGRLPVWKYEFDPSNRRAAVFFDLPAAHFIALLPGARVLTNGFSLAGKSWIMILTKKKPGHAIFSLALAECVDATETTVEFEFYVKERTINPFVSLGPSRASFRAVGDDRGSSLWRLEPLLNYTLGVRMDIHVTQSRT